MTTQITSGASTVNPTVVDGYQATREGRSITHPILGRAEPDVTLRVANLRTGTLRLGFQGATSEAESKAAEDLFSTAATFALVSTDRTSVPMNFYVPDDGSVVRELEDQSRDAWIVSVDFQEIS